MPPEWQLAFRDGTPFWRLSPPPEGMRKNPPPPSRDAELKMRQKVFKLKYQGYIEEGNVKLVIPRFAVPKADDIRVVLGLQYQWAQQDSLGSRFYAGLLPRRGELSNQVVEHASW